ncbi:hypothetical protein PENANT_c029G09316 [Penicillium antarcticum]|uniref:Mediator of RNA polymerase II transcription subunit 20 n=1 Tax=Penicillium antarcticum TaxID=416450 RepID=A0A1V6PVR3_9EURO|nr:uncharacterized protein N7508_001689 [Penicillium antarcticum]KAJ5317181.1 hypothetical protein N7508_001689 [Penicillium antarcticum]OQD81119.1 hypothetical protein PENANT_c029G09316 [Penicillium antarcticum]
MPITGVYFIPSMPNATTALPAVTERLRAAFTDEELTPIGRWGLEQKLFRDTPGLVPASANSNKKASNPRYMQFLSLTHYPTHGFIYTSEPADLQQTVAANLNSNGNPTPAPAQSPAATTPTQNQNQHQNANGIQHGITTTPDHPKMIMTTIPPASYTSLFQHFTYACQPFWCHRLTVTVPNGIVYDIGDFRVRLGDVRQTVPTARVRGTVVEIEWRGPSVVEALPGFDQGQQENHSGGIGASPSSGGDDSGVEFSFSDIEESDVEAEYLATAQLIREFWGRLGLEAKEAVLVPGIGKEVLERLRRVKGGESLQKDGERRVGDVVGSERFEEDLDPSAGTDVARQFMEVLRFNR